MCTDTFAFTETLRQYGFTETEFSFASLMLSLTGKEPSALLFLLSSLAVMAVRQGHTCCPLSVFAGRKTEDALSEWVQLLSGNEELMRPSDTSAVPLPALPADFRSVLRSTPGIGNVLAFVPEQESRGIPLVLSGDRLYLNRYYQYEQSLARTLLERAVVPPLEEVPSQLDHISSRFEHFTPSPEEPSDLQKAAVLRTYQHPLQIITGGPGTGKTTVASSILALFAEKAFQAGKPFPEIVLCAPTGKAAARLRESIQAELPSLNVSEPTRKFLQDLPSATVAKLLKPVYGTPQYRRNRNCPLTAEIVLADEASMISLADMAKLTAAVLPSSRLILLGDRAQLSSVEAGSVLGELCSCGTSNVPSGSVLPLDGCISELVRNHRSASAPHICSLSAEIRNCKADEAGTLAGKIVSMQEADFRTETKKVSALRGALQEVLERKEHLLSDRMLHSFSEIAPLARSGTEEAARTAFELLDHFRVLCAVRKGPCGVEMINACVAELLHFRPGTPAPGMPIMILENDPGTELCNGDVGIIWKTASALCARFPVAGGFRDYPLYELPDWEMAFAMTVHKSQGSGFTQALVILPPKKNPVMTRELVYTAITRAREKVLLWTSEEVLCSALEQSTRRSSGLAETLMKGVLK